MSKTHDKQGRSLNRPEADQWSEVELADLGRTVLARLRQLNKRCDTHLDSAMGADHVERVALRNTVHRARRNDFGFRAPTEQRAALLAARLHELNPELDEHALGEGAFAALRQTGWPKP